MTVRTEGAPHLCYMCGRECDCPAYHLMTDCRSCSHHLADQTSDEAVEEAIRRGYAILAKQNNSSLS
jgi:hypothetical protein